MIIPAILDAIADTPPAPEPTVAASELRPSRANVSRVTELASMLPPRWRAFGLCVERRESHSVPTVINASGHMGLYQFSRSWNRGLPYIVQRALVAAGMPIEQARAVRKRLARQPINHWPAIYQRIGFARVIVEGGRDAALRHWGLQGSVCDGLVAG